MFNDITERKRAEEAIRKSEKKYQDLIDSTLDGIFQVNAEGAFTFMNIAGARIFGYDSPDEIIGKNALDHWRDPKDRDDYRVELKNQKKLSAYPMRAKTKNGEPIELESSTRIIEDEKGNFLGIEGILRDVTVRKRAEEELRQTRRESYRHLLAHTPAGMISSAVMTDGENQIHLVHQREYPSPNCSDTQRGRVLLIMNECLANLVIRKTATASRHELGEGMQEQLPYSGIPVPGQGRRLPLDRRSRIPCRARCSPASPGKPLACGRTSPRANRRKRSSSHRSRCGTIPSTP